MRLGYAVWLAVAGGVELGEQTPRTAGAEATVASDRSRGSNMRRQDEDK